MDQFFNKNSCTLDELTHVYVKNDIYDYARYLVEQNIPFSLLIADIDNFKYVMDTYGLESSNKVLYKVAQGIQAKVGERGAVGRIEGDMFLVILKDVSTYDEAWSFCHELLVGINEVEFTELTGLNLTLTMGLARFPDNAPNFMALYECCEKALFRGKSKGRNCFVIYVPEKHANIVIKSSQEKALSSANLHSAVFRFLSNDDLGAGIKGLMNFLSSYFEIDHICIQADNMLYFERVHQMARNEDFAAIPVEFIKNAINQTTEMYCVNDAKYLLQTKQMELFEVLSKQNITSTCFFDITYQGKSFGMLRADMTGHGKDIRMWQYADLDILLTTAKTLGLILHYTGESIAELLK